MKLFYRHKLFTNRTQNKDLKKKIARSAIPCLRLLTLLTLVLYKSGPS